MGKKYLNIVEIKQRLFDVFNGLTFEYTRDLSGEVIIHVGLKNISINDIKKAKEEFINHFNENIQPYLEEIVNIYNINYVKK
jgi:hypothetical protein